MARGQFTRFASKVGYLPCKICGKELPAEEFQLMKRTYAGQVKHYRQSYCKSCMSTYNTTLDKARRRGDPEYREHKNREAMASYRRNRGEDLRSDREWRIKQARDAIARLNAAHFPNERIAGLTGINRKSLDKWKQGEGRPNADHVLRLRGLIATLVRALGGEAAS